jgi:hypothetical protein
MDNKGISVIEIEEVSLGDCVGSCKGNFEVGKESDSMFHLQRNPWIINRVHFTTY